MAKYAVIRIGGRQHKVTEGETLLIDKMTDLKASPDVLMVVDGEKVAVGRPVLKNAKISFKVVAEVEKGEKVEVYHFKAKSRYRKHTGFRPQYSKILVEKIS